jgi:hypothetical protein
VDESCYIHVLSRWSISLHLSAGRFVRPRSFRRSNRNPFSMLMCSSYRQIWEARITRPNNHGNLLWRPILVTLTKMQAGNKHMWWSGRLTECGVKKCSRCQRIFPLDEFEIHFDNCGFKRCRCWVKTMALEDPPFLP